MEKIQQLGQYIGISSHLPQSIKYIMQNNKNKKSNQRCIQENKKIFYPSPGVDKGKNDANRRYIAQRQTGQIATDSNDKSCYQGTTAYQNPEQRYHSITFGTCWPEKILHFNNPFII